MINVDGKVDSKIAITVNSAIDHKLVGVNAIVDCKDDQKVDRNANQITDKKVNLKY